MPIDTASGFARMRLFVYFLICLPCLAASCADAPATRPVADLIRDLSSTDRATRLLAAEGLRDKGRGAAEAVPALGQRLEDADERVRNAAAEALGAIGAPSMQVLFTYLKHEKFEVRAAAAQALGPTGPGAATELARALQDSHPFVRQRAAESLALIGGFTKNVFPALAEAFNRSGEEPWVRCAIADALGMQGSSAHDAAPMLIQALFDRDAALRTHTVWALGRIGSAGHSLGNVATMLKDEDPQVRAAAADVLGLFGADALPYLRPVVQDPKSDLRLRATASLADIGAAAIPDLEALTKDTDLEIQAAAQAGLASACADETRHHWHIAAGLSTLVLALIVAGWLVTRRRKSSAART